MDGTGDSDLEAEAAFWGIDPARLARDSDATGVWPVNGPAVRAFLLVCNQWRVAPMGLAGAAVIGLDYTAARNGLEMAGTTITPELWAQVQAVESGALGEMREV